MAGPLAHIRVVEITDLRGALMGRLLADLGADVIKIEPPGGDEDRLRPPFVGGDCDRAKSVPFLYRNANKRGVSVDLGMQAGRELLDRILEKVDILIENLGPDGHEKYNMQPSALQERHPRLIVASLSDFGLSGSRCGWRAEPLVAFAASGALFSCGLADMPPCWLPGYTAHDCGAVFAVAGAIAGLLRRAKSAEVSRVEVSAQEAAISGLYPWAIPIADYQGIYTMIPSSPPRMGDGAFVVLPTKGGYVRFVLGTPRHWQGFLELVGRPEELSGKEWEHPIFRLLSADTLRSIGGRELCERGRAELLAEARKLGVPAAPVNTPGEFAKEPQTRERGFFFSPGFRAIGDVPFPGVPFKLEKSPAGIHRPAPMPGEHQQEVLSELKGAARPNNAPHGPSKIAPSEILTGVRVINLGVGAVGPELCSLLGELGAEVIKIESRVNLDFLRKASPDPTQPNRAWVFNAECRGQKSVLLNLKTERGREIALRLAASADIVAENNRGGVVEAWGLDYERVKAVNPEVVYISSQGYGRGGPLGTAAAFGPLNGAFAGVNYLWNHAGAPYPAGSSLNHPDHVASKLAAAVVLAALEHKRVSGQGQFIDMSQAEAAAYLLGEFYLQGELTGKPAVPCGNRVEYAAPHGVYRCRGEDRWVAIAVVGEDAWRSFAKAAVDEAWAGDPRFANLTGRLANQDELDRLVAQWVAQREAEEVAETLHLAGVSACVVQNGDDHRADPHLRERGGIVTVEHAEVGRERHIANPLRIDGAPVDNRLPSPCLGADTDEVLKRLVGLSDEEISVLRDEQVLR